MYNAFCHVNTKCLSAICRTDHDDSQVAPPKVRPKTLVLVVLGSALLFMYTPRLLLYSAGSGVNRVQVILSRLIMRLLYCVYIL